MPTKIQVDDWIRFWRQGELVIGKVEYVEERDARNIHTTAGVCYANGALEVRKPAPSKALDTDHVFDVSQS